MIFFMIIIWTISLIWGIFEGEFSHLSTIFSMLTVILLFMEKQLIIIKEKNKND